ncbi:zinc finger C2H2-type/integrase DNA-binding domain-containing protein [Tanacetum coccineum]
MKSQEDFIQHATTVISSTPTNGVRKIVIRLKTPTKNTNMLILNGETSYAHEKKTERSCFSNAEKMNGKRVLDMDCMTESQENIKKAKKQMYVASTSNALYKPATTRYDEIKKQTDTFKKRKVQMEKRNNLLMRFVNSEGKPACPICKKNYVSKKLLYQHMVLHADKDWETFIKSGEHHNRDAKVVDLSKCLFGCDVKKGKRGRLGSSVDVVKVNKVPNAKRYFGLGTYDPGEVDEDMQEAAKILVLMAHDHQLKAKTSIMAQSEVQAVNGLMCLMILLLHLRLNQAHKLKNSWLQA